MVRIMVQGIASAGPSETQSRRNQQCGQETREQVVQAVAACAADERFAAANTNRIIERADVTWGGLHRYFGDKSRRLDAVPERGMKELQARFEAISLEGEDIRQRGVQVVDGIRIFPHPLSHGSTEIVVNTRGPRADDARHVETLRRMNRRIEYSWRGSSRLLGEPRKTRETT
jgi:AcrR family transcriptional regulator